MTLYISLSHLILFVIFVTLIIPSIICSLFILYHFARSGDLCKRLNNHIILILLLVNSIQLITDMPLTLILLHTGSVPIQTSTYCLYWSVYNYAISVIGVMLMSYGCIERYFLVFHQVFFKKHLLLLHYGPLCFFLIYPPLLYIGLIVIYPCISCFDYTQYACGVPCYQYELNLTVYDWSFNICTPIIAGAIATTVLIVRTILQKRRVGQRAIWQRNRKMVLQLTAVSIIYIIVWVPNVVCFIVPLIIPSPFILELGSNLLIYFPYIAYLFCPFMCLIGLPEIRNSIKEIFTRFNIVQPIVQTIG